MEPVGILGLTGLFSSCLDVLERFNSWTDFSNESCSLAARCEANKLRFKIWGQRVEMTLKMSSASRESSHPLHTRVRKQSNCSITSGTNSEADAESDTDSDHKLSPMSSSSSEPVPGLWAEDIQDWQFSFGIKWALLRLAGWTSGNSESFDFALSVAP
ncbi:hypothetical protein N7447_009167 [Penicillium robsamsonii]|uniref:uncharacterized protein n=1 Tax=Penicillium robsamsonii TaxID=1792511 RepID=UPI00254714C1|nr:uncharacterized protein N7447_009167 [Penicillium robsamsonii]KAJ5816934.1 hypothetical protein N7447_009167 [Penicillium robsamsonii]